LKVVLDTNALVSAALAIHHGRQSGSRSLFEDALIRRGAFESFISVFLIYELADVLGRPVFGLSDDLVLGFVELYTRASTLVDVRNLSMGCRDQRDDKLLEVAVNANVDFIVCRDRDLHAARAQFGIAKTGLGIRERPIRVLMVEDFLAELRVEGAGQ
jgi:putative PIN family toxin of toxin-antitoxin system